MSNPVLEQQIFEAAQQLPGGHAGVTLDVILFLQTRLEPSEHRDLQNAQQMVMNNPWDNEDDEVWNDR